MGVARSSDLVDRSCLIVLSRFEKSEIKTGQSVRASFQKDLRPLPSFSVGWFFIDCILSSPLFYSTQNLAATRFTQSNNLLRIKSIKQQITYTAGTTIINLTNAHLYTPFFSSSSNKCATTSFRIKPLSWIRYTPNVAPDKTVITCLSFVLSTLIFTKNINSAIHSKNNCLEMYNQPTHLHSLYCQLFPL